MRVRIVLLAAVRLAAPAAAQSIVGVRADVANDYFDFWRPPDDRPDDNYTHGAHLRLTLRDLTLDGNTTDAEGLIARRALVPQLTLGVEGALLGVTIGVRAVSRGRDYATAPAWHRWGEITLGWGAG